MASSWIVDVETSNGSQSKRRPRRKVKPISFIDALRKKYCSQDEHATKTKACTIIFHGRPKSDGNTELDYLRHVVLSNSNIAAAGLEGQSLQNLCPNVVDLDLSGNLLESWNEVLPVVSQLKNLKFLNLSDNKLRNTERYLQTWSGGLIEVENLVLNRTNLCWEDVLCLTHILCDLKELHLCGNGYAEVPASGLQGLETIECLRLNGNQIESWSEIWKLRFLSKLKSLILSGNPLLDVFFHENDLDACVCLKADDGLGPSNIDDTILAKETEQNDEVTEKIVNETEVESSNEAGKHEIKPQENCDIIESMDATNDNNVILNDEVNGNDRDSYLNDQIINADRESEDIEMHDDNSANGSDVNSSKMEEEDPEAIKAWCDKIVSDIIELSQEKKDEAGAKQPHCQTESEVIDNTSCQTNTEIGLPGFKLDCKTAEIGESLMCSDRGEAVQYSEAGCDTFQNSLPQELSQGGNSKLEMSKGVNPEVLNAEACGCGDSSAKPPFASLEVLCLSETGLGKWKHLGAVSKFPALTSLRVKDIKLGSSLSQDDRRKLFVACLPNIQSLNGSEVSATEREKAERHLLRHFGDKKKKPLIFHKLQQKHGELQPLVDIDISRGYQEWVSLTFVYRGETMFTDTFSVRQPVGKLRQLIAKNLSLYASIKNIQMYHRFCNPSHQDQDYGEEPRQFEQLNLDSSPMSRFDLMDGDEIHFDSDDQYTGGAFRYLYLRNFMPKKMSELESNM